MQTIPTLDKDYGRTDLFELDFILQSIRGAVLVYKILPDRYEILTCSRGITKVNGWIPEEFCRKIKEPGFKMIHPNDELLFRNTMEKIINAKENGEIVYRGYKRDESIVWLWFLGHYLGEEDGCPLVEGVILDITDNTSMYQTILDQSQSIVTVVDAHTFEALYANQTAKDTVKDKAGEFVGDICHKYVYNLDKPCAFCIVNHTQEDYFVNEELKVKDHYYRQVFKRMLWQGREAIMEFTSDITEQIVSRTIHRELERAELEAKAKAEFYSQMSHDMRTPMNGILGIAELASEENDVEILHRDIAMIRQSGKYMLNLINDTLDLQRIQTGKMKLEPTIEKCQVILEEAITMMTPSIREKNITLQVNVLKNSEMNWYVRVDVLRLKQIVSNIVSNSVKYTPEGGTIEICVGEISRDGMVSHDMIRISDNGVGISEEFLNHGIFEPFSQERNEMSMKYPGSGLGLSIVKKLVELMGGTIQVESKLGVGTVFTIYIDMEMVPDQEVERLNEDASTIHRNAEKSIAGKHLLLCEDHPLNAEITQRLLKKVGCTMEWAENGQDGLKLFRESEPGHFQAILMDIRMPVMNGLETARKIRSCNHPDAATIPIIAMSANAYQEDIDKSMEAGMNAHLAKPIESQKLYETLMGFLL